MILVGLTHDLNRLVSHVGQQFRSSDRTDIAFLASGLAVGLLVGLFSLTVHSIPLTLGGGGGALVAGLIFGWLRSRRPTMGAFRPAAQQSLIDLGLGDMLTGNAFETYQTSAKVQTSYVGWTLFAVGSVTGDQSKIFSPYGTKPNYTDMQQVSFDNAGERALGASAAYDFGYAFKEYGLAGLSAGVWDTQGWGAINPSTNATIADRNELPTSGPLQGLRVKVQYSDLWQASNMRNPQPEFRFIVDYTVLFRPPAKQSNSESFLLRAGEVIE